MTNQPTSPPKDTRTAHRGIVNADVPSETVVTGLPDVGQGASGAHFARDAVPGQAGEGEKQGVDLSFDPDDERS